VTGLRVLIQKGKAGMGNRVLSVLGGIVYAELSGRRLAVDWRDPAYSAGRQNAFGHLFSAPNDSVPPVFLPSASVFPEVWRGRLDRTVDELMSEHEPSVEADGSARINAKYSIDVRRLDYHEDVLVRWSYADEIELLRRHFRARRPDLARLSDASVLKWLMTERLELAPALRQRVRDFSAQHFSETTVGVHVRYTDRKNSFERYPAVIDELLGRDARAVLFLATDNRDVEEQFRARFTRIVTLPKWFPEPGLPLHRVRRCPDKLGTGADALVEMYLLGRCRYLIYDQRSTFGVVARLLSNAPPENVFEMSGFSARRVARRALTFLRR
jgi:Nodulation protein Z (NodZ)